MDGRYTILTDFSVPNPHTKELRNIMKTFGIIHGYIYTFRECDFYYFVLNHFFEKKSHSSAFRYWSLFLLTFRGTKRWFTFISGYISF